MPSNGSAPSVVVAGSRVVVRSRSSRSEVSAASTSRGTSVSRVTNGPMRNPEIGSTICPGSAVETATASIVTSGSSGSGTSTTGVGASGTARARGFRLGDER